MLSTFKTLGFHVTRSRCATIKCIREYSNQTSPDPWSANPIKDLQDWVAISIVKENYQVFNPSLKEIEQGHELFKQKAGREIAMIKSVVSLERLPEQNIPEVSFVGQSNVGKSSLISALFNHSKDSPHIKIGKKPGLTKTLLFFEVKKLFTLVDMPGYGKKMPTYYMKSMHGYLKTRNVLCRSFLLVDSEIGLCEVDKEGLRMMEDLAKPYAIVMTKIDKPRRSVLLKNLLEVLDYINKHTHICFPQPFLVSSPSLSGIKYLQTFIAHTTGNLQLASESTEQT